MNCVIPLSNSKMTLEVVKSEEVDTATSPSYASIPEDMGPDDVVTQTLPLPTLEARKTDAAASSSRTPQVVKLDEAAAPTSESISPDAVKAGKTTATTPLSLTPGVINQRRQTPTLHYLLPPRLLNQER
ncbi:hypothetical protein RUND412_010858 [Rhizina undulata]